MDKKNTTINIPKNMKIIILKNSSKNNIKIVVFNKTKKFKLVYINNIFIDKWSNSIILIKNKFNSLNLKYENNLKKFLNSINIYYFNKIKFKGKGFRIKFFKKTKFIKFFFGRSHKTFLLLKKIKRKKISKYKFMIYGIKNNNIKKITNIINDIKKINFYTLRGLRSSRQIIFKRKGKKGTYI